MSDGEEYTVSRGDGEISEIGYFPQWILAVFSIDGRGRDAGAGTGLNGDETIESELHGIVWFSFFKTAV